MKPPLQPRYRGAHLTGGRPPSTRKERKMADVKKTSSGEVVYTAAEREARAEGLLGDKPWLSGKPYYCSACGAGMPEYLACEDGACKLETVEEAAARREKYIKRSS